MENIWSFKKSLKSIISSSLKLLNVLGVYLEEKPLIYRIYPFTAIREYIAGLMLLILGFRMLSFVASTVTDLDAALILTFIITILAVWRVREIKLDTRGIVRIILLVLVVLSPVIAVRSVEFYRPPSWLLEMWSNIVYSFELFTKTPIAFPALVTVIFVVGGVAILYGALITFGYKILLTDRDITIERSLPLRASYKIPINHIISIEVIQSAVGRRLNYGNILIVTNGMGTILLPKIERPVEFRNLVIERYNKLRTSAEPINESGITLRTYPIKDIKVSLESVCPICLNPVLSSPANEVHISICPFCLSLFHARCLQIWMNENGYKCPVCDRRLRPA